MEENHCASGLNWSRSGGHRWGLGEGEHGGEKEGSAAVGKEGGEMARDGDEKVELKRSVMVA